MFPEGHSASASYLLKFLFPLFAYFLLSDDYMEDKREDRQNCFMLYWVPQFYTHSPGGSSYR